MKKIWVFLAGVGTGMVLLFVILLFVGQVRDNGMTMFEEPGTVIKGDAFEVFQVLPSGDALANMQEVYYTDSNGEDRYSNTFVVVLLPRDERKTLYDDQLIKIPESKCARQIGVYRYMTEKNGEKTVPVVGVYDKEN